MAEMHDVFMKTAFLFASHSKCVSHHVGAVIVKDKRIISVGYNGTPPGLPNCCEVFDKDSFDAHTHRAWQKVNEIHAEMNALAFAAKQGDNIDGCDMYVTVSPCEDCLKNLSVAGIKNIYYLYLYDVELNPDILGILNVREVPGAEDIKKFVEKNELLYIPKQRRIQKELEHENSYFVAQPYCVITKKAEVETTEYFIDRPVDGKKFRVWTPFYEKYLEFETGGHLEEHNGELVFKINT